MDEADQGGALTNVQTTGHPLVRAYDPCLSCSTHAIRDYPIEIQLISPDGEVLDKLRS